VPSGPVVIRDEQLRRMGAALFDEYTGNLMTHLREIFPRRMAAAGPEAARRLADRALARGKELGFTTERNLTLWVDLYFALGSQWERARGMRWLLDIAEDRSEHQDARMYLIYRRIPVRCPSAGDAEEAP
jgi:hypothetical protein